MKIIKGLILMKGNKHKGLKTYECFQRKTTELEN